jgi:hypothetical protein
MAFKLLLSAEERWRRVNAPHLVVLVGAGVKFPNGEAQMLQMDDSSEGGNFPVHSISRHKLLVEM